MKKFHSFLMRARSVIAPLMMLSIALGQPLTGYGAETSQNPSTGQPVPVVSFKEGEMPTQNPESSVSEGASSEESASPLSSVTALQNALDSLRSRIASDGADPSKTIDVKVRDAGQFTIVSALWRDSKQGMENRESFIYVREHNRVDRLNGFVDMESFNVVQGNPDVLIYTTELRGNKDLVHHNVRTGELTVNQGLPTDRGHAVIQAVSQNTVFMTTPGSKQSGVAYIYVKDGSTLKKVEVQLPKKTDGSYEAVFKTAEFGLKNNQAALKLETPNGTEYTLYRNGGSWDKWVAEDGNKATPKLLSEIQTLENKIASENKVIGAKQNKIEEAQSQIADKNKQIQKIRQRPGNLSVAEKKAIAKIENQIAQVQETIKNIQEQIAEHRKTANQYRSRINTINRELDRRGVLPRMRSGRA